MAGAARLLSQLRTPLCPSLQLISRFGASICTISECTATKGRPFYSLGSFSPSVACGTTSSPCSGRSEGGWSSSAVLIAHMRGSYLCQARAYSDNPSGTGRNGGGRDDRSADEEIPGDTMGSVLPDATQFKPSSAAGDMDGLGMDESGSDYGGAAAGLMATGVSNHDGEDEVSSDVKESWGEAGLDFDAAMDDMDDIGKLGALVESAGENAAAALLAARSQTDPEAHLAREAREKKSEFFEGVPQRLMKQRRKEAIKTGALIDPLSQYIEGRQHPAKVTAGWCAEVVDVKMTQARTASGTRYTYSSMAVVGNMQGWGGWAIGKSSEPDTAVNKAILRAIKDAVFIPRYRGHTIYSPMFVKHTRTKLFMWPRERGFGIVGHPLLIEMCELLGLHDITVKVHGSRLTRNMVKAFFAALQLIQTPRDRAMGQRKYIREVTPYVRSVLSSPAS